MSQWTDHPKSPNCLILEQRPAPSGLIAWSLARSGSPPASGPNWLFTAIQLSTQARRPMTAEYRRLPSSRGRCRYIGPSQSPQAPVQSPHTHVTRRGGGIRGSWRVHDSCDSCIFSHQSPFSSLSLLPKGGRSPSKTWGGGVSSDGGRGADDSSGGGSKPAVSASISVAGGD